MIFDFKKYSYMFLQRLEQFLSQKVQTKSFESTFARRRILKIGLVRTQASKQYVFLHV